VKQQVIRQDAVGIGIDNIFDLIFDRSFPLCFYR